MSGQHEHPEFATVGELSSAASAIIALEDRLANVETWIRAHNGQPEPEPEPTPGPAPGPSPSGEPMPSTDPEGWVRTFQDDFVVPAAEGQFESKYPGWSPYPESWPDTSRNGRYGSAVVSAHDSLLDVHCRQIDGIWRVAALNPRLLGGQGRTSHRVAVRFRADPVAGFKTAWLLWPMPDPADGKEHWPRDGEIDFPEGDLDGRIAAFMHRQGATSGGDQDGFSTLARYPDWHTAVTEWDAGQRCAFYLDGQLIGKVLTSRVPATPMRYVLQTETRLSGGPPPAGARAHVLVDWFVMWTRP